MNRSCRVIAIMLAVLGAMALVCGLVLFLIFGDRIATETRDFVRNVRLAFREDDLNAPAGDDPSPIQFTVSDGQGAQQIAAALFANDLINDVDLFVDYAIAEGITDRLGLGVYFLNETMSIKEIARALTGLEYRAIDFTVFGGQRIEEVAASIDANPRFNFDGEAFLNLVRRGAVVDPQFAAEVDLPEGTSLEGFLMPGRYTLPPDITALELRDTLLDEFFAEIETFNLVEPAADSGYTWYEVVTLASIVQREAMHDDERPLIAGVYLNRLERPDPDTGEAPPQNLDADPTVQYALGEEGNWWPQITQADYNSTVSEYNTYRVSGLPPGPINSPSIESIRAVLFPEASDFFYFRADCRSDGYHEFAPNFTEHLNNGC